MQDFTRLFDIVYYQNEKYPQADAFAAKENGQWRFLDARGIQKGPYVRPEPKVGRNDPCPCGSGKKYKACCGKH